METRNKLTNKIFKLTPAKTIILGFLGIILIGTLLLCLPISHTNNQWFGFVDSFFTSTSAVCVTGLSVIDVAKQLTLFGQIVILILIQIGGIGFVTLACLIFMLLGKKINYSTRMSLQESLNTETTQGLVKMVRKIILVVFSVEFIGFLCLAPSMINFADNFASGCFKALFLSISAFCNAGFDPLGDSTMEFSNLAHFANNSFVLIPVMLLIVLGGIGFVVIFDLFNFKRETKKIQFHTKVVLIITSILILGGALLFAIFEWNNPNTIGNMNTFNKIINCFFQSITPRTAGFATFDQGALTSASVYITNFLMIIGGSPMGIAGGIKTTTFLVLIIILFKQPLNDGSYNFKKLKFKNKTIFKTIRLLLSVITLISIGSLLISLFEIGKTITFTQILFETISAVSTVGLTLGITPILTIGSKLVLTLLMFIGRVGMLTIPLAFSTKNNIENEIEFADSKIIVG